MVLHRRSRKSAKKLRIVPELATVEEHKIQRMMDNVNDAYFSNKVSDFEQSNILQRYQGQMRVLKVQIAGWENVDDDY